MIAADAGKLPNLTVLRALFGPDPACLPTINLHLASLGGYEALIGAAYTGEVA